METILDHWWQFSIVVSVLIIGAIALGITVSKVLAEISNSVRTLLGEVVLKSEFKLGSVVNLVLIFFLGIAMLAVVIPNPIVQVGLKEEKVSFFAVLTYLGFIFVGLPSGYWIFNGEKILRTYRDDDLEIDAEKEKHDRSSEDKRRKRKKKLSGKGR